MNFMKTALPLLLGLVWAPIVWLSVSSMLSPALLGLSASYALAGVISLLFSAAIVFLFVRLFARLAGRIGGGEE